ncbi:MAG: 30S ribosome-binding factor RbfA [Candidatus Caldatribacteriaceae bacterium]
MKEQRPKRVAELIKREVSQILFSRIEDPRIKRFTITRVEVSPDLRLAKIFVSFDEEEREGKFRTLQKATHFVKAELAKRIRIKFMPEIIFIADNTFEKAFQVVALLSKIEQEIKK